MLLGSLIGPFRVDALIGEGGMGQVYRARDTVLQRDVALKILPAAFVGDPERMARFSREAQVLAALNHPHIAAIYCFERSAGTEPPTHALVLEFVDGPTLADRIAQGPIRVDEALPIARQIAEALEAAHEQGIVHRDLKPANVKVRPDGAVKVLDFGLAKVFGPDDGMAVAGRPPAQSPASSPTVASPALTAHGMILGTAAYMAPEQARGRAADQRSDVWSFGCVLFEMLSGTRAFGGDDVADTLAGLLRGEPDWRRLPADTPRSIVRLLQRCLVKDPGRRLPAIAAARYDIAEALSGAADDVRSLEPPPSRPRWSMTWMIAGALLVGLAAGVAVTSRRAQDAASDAPVIRFTIPPPENAFLGGYVRPGNPTSQPQFAASPDGRHVVIVANTQGVDSLWLRSLDTLDTRRLPGTEGASMPFWSPDSRWVAFFAGGALRRLPVAGGSPVVICTTGEGSGGTWNRDDVIVFKSERPGTERTAASRGLQRVAAGGGLVEAATSVVEEDGVSHAWPYFLPDGQHFLYVAIPSAREEWDILVGRLGSNAATRTGTTSSATLYGAGHLFFWKDGSILAQAFDAATRQPTGDPFPVANGVGRGPLGDVSFSISAAGTMVHASGVRRATSQLTWLDRTGRRVGTVGEPGRYAAFALSPDDRRVVVTRDADEGSRQQHLWTIDVVSGLSAQLTFDRGTSLPVWSRDGRRLALSGRGDRMGSDLYRLTMDGSAAEELLLRYEGSQIPTDWSSDGRLLLFTHIGPTNLDVWGVPIEGERKPYPILQTAANEEAGTFSPDGRWIAYQSDESGTDEIYVQPFPPTGAKVRMSARGGRVPQWRADGRELYYLAADGSLMAVPVSAGSQVIAGSAQRLFQTDYNRRRGRRFYSATRDGRRFLIPVYQDSLPDMPLTVILNWPASLKR